MTDATRTGKAVQKALPISIKRTMGLETAAAMLGSQAALAEAIGIEPRSLRLKFTADRGISDTDLLAAADALDARSARIAAHAEKLRAEARG